MIVSDPPFDLIALFADADAQKLFEAVIERGQERRCLGAFRWRSIRDPRRDALARHPDHALGPLLRPTCRFLITWDHEGSGCETEKPDEVEKRVVDALCRRGVPSESVLAVALVPEVEHLLVPVFRQCLSVLSEKRSAEPPVDHRILARAEMAERDFIRALSERPKELLSAAIQLLNLRPSAALFQELGGRLSSQTSSKGRAPSGSQTPFCAGSQARAGVEHHPIVAGYQDAASGSAHQAPGLRCPWSI